VNLKPLIDRLIKPLQEMNNEIIVLGTALIEQLARQNEQLVRQNDLTEMLLQIKDDSPPKDACVRLPVAKHARRVKPTAKDK